MNEESKTPVQETFAVGRSFILPVGLPLHIKLDGVTVLLKSISIGFFPDQYIIIGHPYSENLGPVTNKLFRGNKIEVRYLNCGNIFVFESKVLGATNDPFKVAFIDYPKTIVRHNLRKNRRVQCYLPAELYNESKKDENVISCVACSGIISDISISGCSFDMIVDTTISTPEYIRINGSIVLRMQLPGIEKEIELVGVIKRLKRDSTKMNIGIMFDTDDDVIINRITEYILSVENFNPIY